MKRFSRLDLKKRKALTRTDKILIYGVMSIAYGAVYFAAGYAKQIVEKKACLQIYDQPGLIWRGIFLSGMLAMGLVFFAWYLFRFMECEGIYLKGIFSSRQKTARYLAVLFGITWIDSLIWYMNNTGQFVMDQLAGGWYLMILLLGLLNTFLMVYLLICLARLFVSYLEIHSGSTRNDKDDE